MSKLRIDKVVRIGVTKAYNDRIMNVYCRIKFINGKLSITGVEGPKANGNAIGSCGQIDSSIREYASTMNLAPAWTPDMLTQFLDVWKEWHLNDLQAGCEHQRAEKWAERPIDKSKPANAYVQLADGYSGWNMLTWLPVDKGGLLSAPCTVCGYKYGTAWLCKEVPQSVLEFLESLPETDQKPAWV